MFYLPLDEFKRRIKNYKFIKKIDNIYSGFVDGKIQRVVMIFSSKEEFENSKINFVPRIIEKEMQLIKKKYYKMARKELGYDYVWRIAEGQMRPILEKEQKDLTDSLMKKAIKLENWQQLYMVRQKYIIMFPEFRQDQCKLLTTDYFFAKDYKNEIENDKLSITLGRKFLIQGVKPVENKNRNRVQLTGNVAQFIKNNNDNKDKSANNIEEK